MKRANERCMFLLVTGASGMGKSTVRTLVAAEFRNVLQAAELAEVASTPQWSLSWRHQAVEQAVQHALHGQRIGKHFLLCGDPVPPGELYAAPSADHLDRIAVCLLDAAADAQRQRLMQRGDDPAFIPHHIAFAAWMREHVVNPRYRPTVITQGGWEHMRWDRWLGSGLQKRPWNSHMIDTTACDPPAVGKLVSTWICQQINLCST